MSTDQSVELSGIIMRAKDVAPTRTFYEKNWGLTHLCTENGVIYFRGAGSGQYIYGLREDDHFGIDYVNFSCGTRKAIDRLHGHCVARGISVTGVPKALTTPGGGYGFTAVDPENRRLQFSTGVAKHAELLDDLDRPRRITHVVLNSPDMENLQAFYGDAFGMRISDYSADQMVFLRMADDHHAIAINRAPYSSINHVAFEMRSIDAFMRGIGRMKTLGQAPAWGPGRHGPGNNPFAYFVSPSGFVIEFTAEVQKIDESTHVAQVWPRDVPEKMDQWMTAGPPTPAMRAVMAGRPDPGFPVGV